ncbi:7-carboxy-7-deazaguanine synthase QueE [Chitinophaga rhizosphaerae]|uniref:7-carboxy-7-deazaguanine synthase QueE n=1 Tax=Chitinophaga rhizosphaerae TaxID=1864947 RepID=UPI000F7FADF4|nr:7-carboxy-7-deazaguanine synthase QueE [Chitinophaga rhizosphaerae]
MTTATLYTTTVLPVMESFYTIQGEGFHQGKAAYFIRLGGCDVGCVWCDVKESWDADKHPKRPIGEIVAEAAAQPGRIAVITGGEPLMHDLQALTSALQAEGFRTHMETSGSSPLSGQWDWITLSPKKFKAPLPEICAVAHELKIVIYNKSDFAWAEQYATLAGPHCKLYLQPEWSKASQMTPLIIEYVKSNPQWQISLQIHKYLNVP